MRINVFISSTGYCSRRQADRLIQEQRVMLNGKIAQIGQEITEADDLSIDGRPLQSRKQTVYLVYHKPRGIESTTDQSKPNNIIDAVGYPERIFPIGRLDKDTSGLILLTNDGQIVNQILRKEFAHEKEYLVEVQHPIHPDFVKQMETGVVIYNPVRHEKTMTLPTKISVLNQTSFQIILTQGLNLQIRRMCEALGNKVVSLKRVRIMHIRLGKLEVGKYRELTENERRVLLESLKQAPKNI